MNNTSAGDPSMHMDVIFFSSGEHLSPGLPLHCQAQTEIRHDAMATALV